MNLSGDFVAKFINYFSINTNNVLVIYDDINLNIGTFRYRKKGSSGGQNGIKDILNKLSTTEIARIKIGINSNSNMPLIKYVLNKISSENWEILFQTIDQIANTLIKNIDKNSNVFL